MDSEKQYVKILLLGDNSVGKTSVIIGLATEQPPISVPPKAHELYITEELTNQNLPALIVDTNLSQQTETDLINEIKEADVLCLIYSLTDIMTYDRITQYWLPFIRSACSELYKPIVIIGNKSDAIDGISEDLDMLYITEQHPEVEGYFIVSALDLLNLVETFQFSLKTFLQPIRPLIDIKTKTISSSFEQALHRIFSIFDSDGDGVILWHEMLDFQKTVFKNLLYRQILHELRETISSHISDGLTERGFTISGFIFIHKLFIMRGMRDSIWKVLNAFGYNINLELDENYLVPCFNINPGEYIELNSSGIEFFEKIFKKHDKDMDNALNFQEFSSVFRHFPTFPFKDTDLEYCDKNAEGSLTIHGFLSLFVRSTHISPATTLCALSILGYDKGEWHSSLNALQKTPSRHNEFDHQIRTTFVCSVFGPFDCGKSSFIAAMMGYIPKDHQPLSAGIILCAVNIDNIKKKSFIIIEEVPWYEAENYSSTRFFDAAVFLFDASESSSFQFCREIHSHLSHNILSMVIGAKKDIGIVPQISDVDPNAYCSNNTNSSLQHCSFKCDEISFFTNIFNHISRTIALKSTPKKRSSYFQSSLFVLITITTIASLTSFVIRKIRS